jgi:enediyne biosynthesis protein E4
MRRVCLRLALASLPIGISAATAESRLAIPSFVEETMEAGIDSVFEGEWEFMVGGGVATFDCSENGFPDMFLAGGEAPSKFYRNMSERDGPLRFSEEESGLELEDVAGAYPLDIDGDGIMDLVLLRVGENVVMRGLGDCRFERANEAWSFDGGDAWTPAFSARWAAGSGWPTLAFGNYLDESSDDNSRLCHDNEVVRPAVSGDRFARPTALAPGWCALSMLFSDWDRSGRRDLRVSNDRHYYSDYGNGQEQLWRLDAEGPPRAYGADDGWRPLRIWGMGIAGADLTGDGLPEYF